MWNKYKKKYKNIKDGMKVKIKKKLNSNCQKCKKKYLKKIIRSKCKPIKCNKNF